MGRLENIRTILLLIVTGILIAVSGLDFFNGEYRGGGVALLGVAYILFFLWSGRNWDSFSQRTRNICLYIVMAFVVCIVLFYLFII